MSYRHAYAKYVAALPPDKRCACQQHPIGRCPVCSPLPQEETLIDIQLSFTFVSQQQSSIYTKER
jgi:hypothetical protein